jgi:hypothetical protein
MPVSVHKILIHKSKIISTVILAIGQLSEKAQEFQNKDVKHFRSYMRKTSRKTTTDTLLHLLLVSSDPLITNLWPPPTKVHNIFFHKLLYQQMNKNPKRKLPAPHQMIILAVLKMTVRGIHF